MLKTLVTLTFIASLNISANVVKKLPSLKEVRSTSHEIVLATVVNRKPKVVRNNVFTIHDLVIDQVLKGSFKPNEQFELTFFGGSVGSLVTFRPGSPELKSNTQYLMFLNRSGHNKLLLTHGRFGLLSPTDSFVDPETKRKYSVNEIKNLILKEERQ